MAFMRTAVLRQATRFQSLLATVKPGLVEVTAPEAAREAARPAAERPLLIDVREASEWEQARIAGDNVVHLARGVLERDIERVVPNATTPLILYCAGGMRSLLAAESLKRMGYTNVKSLAGGISDWANRGLPIDAVPKRRPT